MAARCLAGSRSSAACTRRDSSSGNPPSGLFSGRASAAHRAWTLSRRLSRRRQSRLKIDGDFAKPGRKFGTAAERPELPVGAQKGVLRQFFGVVERAGHAKCHCADHFLMLLHQRGIGFRVAGKALLNQLGFVVGRRPCAPFYPIRRMAAANPLRKLGGCSEFRLQPNLCS